MRYPYSFAGLFLALTTLSQSTMASPKVTAYETAPDSFIVVWDSNQSRQAGLSDMPSSLTATLTPKHISTVSVFERDQRLTLKQAMIKARSIPGVVEVHPDYILHALQTPNDPEYSQLWGLNNTNDVDINAPEAWDVNTGSEAPYVVVIDSGIDYEHEDLAANIWTNPDEIAGNGIDDDNNGWIDDVHGIDTVNNDGDPMDDQSHGTHVSGTIAAVGNNGVGSTGVSWNTKLIGCKFLNQYGSGTISGALACLDYVSSLKVDKGLNIVATNNSWGGGDYSSSLYEAIENQLSLDILFVAAAGNDFNNNDQFSTYPSTFDLDNIISVGAINSQGELAYFSNYGATSVDVMAPGVDIFSTTPNDTYDTFSGTSMAAPHVAGAIALAASQNPEASGAALKQLILGTAEQSTAINDFSRHGLIRLWGEDGSGAINCSDQAFVSRIQPALSTLTVPVGETLDIVFSNANCLDPGEALVLDIGGSSTLTLLDDGQGVDVVAGDGLFSGQLDVSWIGEVTIAPVGIDDQEMYITGVDMPVMRDAGYAYIDLSETQELPLTDDSYVFIEPGFTVSTPFGELSGLYVSSNGVVMGSDPTISFSNTLLPDSNLRPHFYAPYWDDLIAGFGEYNYGITGEAPDRQLVINYQGIKHYSSNSTDDLDFQIVFSESTPTVYFNYKDVTTEDSATRSNGGGATVGFQHEDIGVTYSHNEAVLQDLTSLVIAPAEVVADLPVITAFEYSGIARHGYPIQITAAAELVDNDTLPVMELDLGLGEGFEAYDPDSHLQHTYDEGIYTLRFKASHNLSNVVRSLTLEVLPLSDTEEELIAYTAEQTEHALLESISDAPADYGYTTLEQAQIDADNAATTREEAILASPNDWNLHTEDELTTAVLNAEAALLLAISTAPADFGYVTLTQAQANTTAAVETATEAAIETTTQAIQGDPESYGLARLTTTPEEVAALPAGTYLVGASTDIANMNEFFADVRFVWSFQNGEFAGWSPDEALMTRIQNSGYAIIENIDAGQGFWVSK